jgi:hypothetical protein
MSASGSKYKVKASHDEVYFTPEPDIGSRFYQYTPY